MHVAVYSRIYKEADALYIQQLFELLHQEGVITYIFAPYFEQIKNKISFPAFFAVFDSYEFLKNNKIDFLITLGGDGTILHAITVVRDTDIPILGINLGRLGFLAGVEKHRIKEAIFCLKKGSFLLDERQLLYLESNHPIFGELSFALNDCTILKRDTSSLITIHTYINGAFLNSYWADGIIISTPTGSTGYSLSCGGPIIFPQSGNFVITPVASHNLNVRPIVVSDNTVISLQVEGRADNFLCTLDSRFRTITSDHQLAVRKCDFSVKLVRLPDSDFQTTINTKLGWGLDKRNND